MAAGHRCDTHVLSARGNGRWLGEALASLDGEPTQVHLIEGGFAGSIGAARAYALGLGTAPYVSWLDDDDRLLPGVLAQCIAYLDAHPACVGVYTDRLALTPDGRLTERRSGPWNPRRQLCDANLITHAKVLRRDLALRYLAELARWPTWEEYVLCGLLAAHGPWHHLPVLGAIKRERARGAPVQPGDSTRLAAPGLWECAVARVAPVLLAAPSPST